MTHGGSSFTFTQPHPPPHREAFIVQPPKRHYWLHILLFLLTALTTLIVGARLQQNFLTNQPMFVWDNSSFFAFFPLRWILQQPSRLLMGIPFSATLLGILMAHEMGHFAYSARNGVYATLPFFIPAPTPFGTMGAFIKIKSPFRSRWELFDIGIAGPIAGFIVAVPMAFVGLMLSRPFAGEIDPSTVQLGQPVIFHMLHWSMNLFRIGNAAELPLSLVFLHPIALAAWIGMMATAFNLLPGGQLDGGHITYAVRPSAHGGLTRLTMIALVPLAIFYWVGWFVWILGLGLTMRHPPVPAWPDLNVPRRYLTVVAAIILALTFTPDPFPGAGLLDVLRH